MTGQSRVKMVMPRLSHESRRASHVLVTCRSQALISHESVTCQSTVSHGSVTGQSRVSHGSVMSQSGISHRRRVSHGSVIGPTVTRASSRVDSDLLPKSSVRAPPGPGPFAGSLSRPPAGPRSISARLRRDSARLPARPDGSAATRRRDAPAPAAYAEPFAAAARASAGQTRFDQPLVKAVP